MTYSKTCVNGHSQKYHYIVFKTNYRLMKVKTFIKLPFVLSIFEWPFNTGLTVQLIISDSWCQIRWNISIVYKGLYHFRSQTTYDMNVDASFSILRYHVLLIIEYTMGNLNLYGRKLIGLPEFRKSVLKSSITTYFQIAFLGPMSLYRATFTCYILN